jgi:hypothetical protein
VNWLDGNDRSVSEKTAFQEHTVFDYPHVSRREMLNRLCIGFGGLAANVMLGEKSSAAPSASAPANPLAAKPPHFPARAKRIIFLFMQGGPSHVDTFDHKPQLKRDEGKPLPFKATRVQFAKRGNLMASPWEFRPTGQSGIPMSQLWQHLPEVADDLCMIHSVCDTNVAHGGATMKLHTGHEALVRPAMGAWVSYGLGTQNENLPGFVTVCPSSVHGGVNNFGSAFLPAVHQGVSLGTPGYPNEKAKQAKFKYMTPRRTAAQQRLQLDLLRRLSQKQTVDADEQVDARLQSFELAFRMQMAAPEVLDIRDETSATRSLYGLDDEPTEDFGLQCLLARRFAERGVRFIQVNHAHSLGFNNEQWDQHTYLKKGHEINAAQVDLPITGLIKDLKARGLLEDTLVLWGGEFGRTPTVELSGNNGAPIGRDHHTDGFTMWMAGGGVRGGYRYGKTDDYGYYTVENRCTLHDLHATMLHLMGLDHLRLTYRYAGRDFRLTDVAGRVVNEIIA